MAERPGFTHMSSLELLLEAVLVTVVSQAPGTHAKRFCSSPARQPHLKPPCLHHSRKFSYLSQLILTKILENKVGRS